MILTDRSRLVTTSALSRLELLTIEAFPGRFTLTITSTVNSDELSFQEENRRGTP